MGRRSQRCPLSLAVTSGGTVSPSFCPRGPGVRVTSHPQDKEPCSDQHWHSASSGGWRLQGSAGGCSPQTESPQIILRLHTLPGVPRAPGPEHRSQCTCCQPTHNSPRDAESQDPRQRPPPLPEHPRLPTATPGSLPGSWAWKQLIGKWLQGCSSERERSWWPFSGSFLGTCAFCVENVQRYCMETYEV